MQKSAASSICGHSPARTDTHILSRATSSPASVAFTGGQSYPARPLPLCQLWRTSAAVPSLPEFQSLSRPLSPCTDRQPPIICVLITDCNRVLPSEETLPSMDSRWAGEPGKAPQDRRSTRASSLSPQSQQLLGGTGVVAFRCERTCVSSVTQPEAPLPHCPNTLCWVQERRGHPSQPSMPISNLFSVSRKSWCPVQRQHQVEEVVEGKESWECLSSSSLPPPQDKYRLALFPFPPGTELGSLPGAQQ